MVCNNIAMFLPPHIARWTFDRYAAVMSEFFFDRHDKLAKKFPIWCVRTLTYAIIAIWAGTWLSWGITDTLRIWRNLPSRYVGIRTRRGCFSYCSDYQKYREPYFREPDIESLYKKIIFYSFLRDVISYSCPAVNGELLKPPLCLLHRCLIYIGTYRSTHALDNHSNDQLCCDAVYYSCM